MSERGPSRGVIRIEWVDGVGDGGDAMTAGSFAVRAEPPLDAPTLLGLFREVVTALESDLAEGMTEKRV